MKKLKNLLPSLLIMSLIIGTALIGATFASPTALSVIFANGTNFSIGEYYPLDEFTVDIEVTSVTDLYTFEFKLKYDTDLLTATSITLGTFFPGDAWEVKKEINDPAGFAWYAVSMPLGSETGETGSGTLATISFTVDALGATVLDLSDTILGNSPPNGGEAMPHEVIDGALSNIGTYPIALFTYDPATPETHEKVTFDASASFSNVTIISYEWDFGDGESDAGVITTHAYGTAGIYTVTLTVTDEVGSSSADRTIEIVPPAYKVDLARRGAWPEHHRYSISGDEDGNQTLFAKIANSKYASETAAARVLFTILDANGLELPGSPFITTEATLVPGDITDLPYDLDVTGLSGKYYVTARCYYYDGGWIAGAKTKAFSFVIVP